VIRGCEIDDQFIERILIALDYDDYVRFFDFSHNNIGALGTKLLTRHIKRANHIAGLNMKENPGYTPEAERKLSYRILCNIKWLKTKHP